METEANKAIVRRYLEMWNTGKLALADEVLAPGYRDHAHPEITSIEQVKQALIEVRNTFPDFHISIESLIGEGEMVAVFATVSRRKEGGSRVMWFVRLTEGKMIELWTGIERAN